MENLPEWAQNSWFYGALLTGGVTFLLGMFAKICPKTKLVAWTVPASKAFGKLVSKTLILRFGQRAADRVEEGLIVTLLEVAHKNIKAIKDGLLEDNQTKKAKPAVDAD